MRAAACPHAARLPKTATVRSVAAMQANGQLYLWAAYSYGIFGKHTDTIIAL
jgi:hypothetical protein